MVGIELHGPPGPMFAVIGLAEIDRKRCTQRHHMGIQGIQFIGPLVVLFGLCELASIHHDLTEDEMAPAFRGIKRQSPLCRRDISSRDLRTRFPRPKTQLHQGEPGERERVVGIERQRLLEHGKRGCCRSRIEGPRQVNAAQQKIIRLHVLRALAARGRSGFFFELAGERRNDRFGNLVLRREEIVDDPVEALRPEGQTGSRVGQLRRQPDDVAGTADAALYDVVDPELR